MKIRLLIICFLASVLCSSAAPRIHQQRGLILAPRPAPREAGNVVVNAGPDQVVTNSLTFSLLGNVSGGWAKGFRFLLWLQTSGPAATINAPNNGSTLATASGDGTYVFLLTATDGVLFRTDSVTVIVNTSTVPANTPPTVSTPLTQNGFENAPISSIPVTVGDAETAPGALTVTALSSTTGLVSQANVSVGGSGANRTITLTPTANISGQTTITISVTDAGGLTATTFFDAIFAGVNDFPSFTSTVANQNVGEDSVTGPLSFGIADQETPAANLILSVSSTNSVLFPSGSLVLGGSGAARNITLTPAANLSGQDQVTVLLSDGQASIGMAFSVTVNAVNDAPIISDIPDSAGGLGQPTVLNFNANDVESGGLLTYTATSSNPSVVPVANIVFGGIGTNRTATITGASGGLTTITITATDSGTLFDADSFVFSVNPPINTAPTVTGIANQTINEDSATGALAFTIGDGETAAGSLTVTGLSSDIGVVPASGIVFGGSGASRTVTITPAANQSGVSSITVSVSDGTATTSTSFSVTVTAVNDSPTISQSSPQSTPEDVAKVVSFTIGDQETSAASLTLVKSSSNQTLVPDANIVLGGSGANRTATITPGLNQTGSATISIIVSDGSLTATNAFLFVVGAVNDPPTISAISGQTVNEDTATSAIAFTISDPETAAGTLTVSANSSNLPLLPIANAVFGGSGGSRTVTLTPSANANGTSTVTISTSDGTNSVSTAFTFTVNAVNDAPSISALANQTVVEPGSTGALPFTVGDLETAAVSLIVTGASGNTTLVPTANIAFGGSGANRTVTVTPAAGQTGSTTITVTVNDGTTTANSPFTLTVVSGNTAPTITDIANQVINENAATPALPFTVGDAQTTPGSLAVSATTSNPTLVPIGNVVFGGSGASRTVTVTPAANQFGSSTITVTVSDGNLTATDAFTVTVNSVPDAPVVASITSKSMTEDIPIQVPVSATDPDSATLTWTATSSVQGVVANAGLSIPGTGLSATLTITPVSNASGTTVITVTANDGVSTDQETFTLTVTAANDPPTISNVTDKVTPMSTASGPHSFTVGDVETAATALTVTGTSNNQTLVPNANIVFTGSGANRNVTVTPASGQSGQATISITVSDGTAAAQDTFVLTVTGGISLEYYVSTSGSFGNPGTLASPWNMDRGFSVILGKPEVGATVWIRGGIYDAEYDSDATGVIYKAYQNEIPRIGPRDPEVGHVVFSPHGANNQFWRLVWDCDVKQSEAEGIYSSDSGAGNKWIFCLVKDLPQCMGLQDNRPSGGGSEVYGTVLLFGGWDNSDTDPGGHNGYFQNRGTQFKFIKSVSAYSHSKLINSGGSAAASNKNWLISDNIFLWDGGASQAAYDLGRFVEYIAFIGNDPIENAIYRDNFHVGGKVLFGYPDPLNVDVTVTGNFEIHPGFGNGTFSGIEFSKFQNLTIRSNIVDVSFDPTMDLDNSGAVSRSINFNQYFGTLDFNPGGSFSGWQGNGYDSNGSATTAHWSTLYIDYIRFSEYPNEPERSLVAIWNPQSQSSVSLDGAQCGLVNGDQYVILNTLHPDMAISHKFKVATAGTYTGSPISVPIGTLTVGTPKGKGSSPPNCHPKSGALLVKKTN